MVSSSESDVVLGTARRAITCVLLGVDAVLLIFTVFQALRLRRVSVHRASRVQAQRVTLKRWFFLCFPVAAAAGAFGHGFAAISPCFNTPGPLARHCFPVLRACSIASSAFNTLSLAVAMLFWIDYAHFVRTRSDELLIRVRFLIFFNPVLLAVFSVTCAVCAAALSPPRAASANAASLCAAAGFSVLLSFAGTFFALRFTFPVCTNLRAGIRRASRRLAILGASAAALCSARDVFSAVAAVPREMAHPGASLPSVAELSATLVLRALAGSVLLIHMWPIPTVLPRKRSLLLTDEEGTDGGSSTESEPYQSPPRNSFATTEPLPPQEVPPEPAPPLIPLPPPQGSLL